MWALNESWFTVIRSLGTNSCKIQLETLLFLGPNIYIFENAVCKITASLKSQPFCWGLNELTHWGQVMHICISKLNIIGSGNGSLPGRRQAIIWTNAGILLIWTLGTYVSEILSVTHRFSFKKMHSKISSAKWRHFVLSSVCWEGHCIPHPIHRSDLHLRLEIPLNTNCISVPSKETYRKSIADYEIHYTDITWALSCHNSLAS